MRIAMIGTGYVGLVSGACFADFGHQVTCVDKDAGKIEALRRGEIPIFEPGLDALVASNVKAKRLDFTTDLTAPVAEADAVFIAVGTPSRRGDGHADLTYVYSAAREIAAALSGFTVVVTKSTVPVGTGDEVERLIREANPSADVVVASNPEFLREGAAIRDFKFPDRVVVGTSDERGRKVLGDVYRPLSLNQAPLMFTARRTAELIKYAAAPSSCMPARALAAPAFPRTSARWSRSRSITMCSCGSSRRCLASTTTASARWRERFPTRRGAACAARPWRCLG
jgi:UDPglucose 6-dehydrogenase